jgi:DNA-binding transcriptional LysR family regulator
LFDRLGRTVRLTSFGQTFLPRADAILREVDDAKQEIEEMAGLERGRIAVGAIPTIAPYFLASRLASFALKFPEVQSAVFRSLLCQWVESRSQPHEGLESRSQDVGTKRSELCEWKRQ